MSTFQAFILGLFIIFLLGGVAAFALFQANDENALPPLTIWGTLPTSALGSFLGANELKEAGLTLSYVEKDPATIQSELTESLAEGRAPDLVLFPHELIYREQNKLAAIPSTVISERDFKDAYINGAEIFLTGDGALGIPVVVDPLVMYWNRNMFSGKAIAAPPKFWDEFYALAPKFNERTESGTLLKTAVALGETSNVAHFKEIVSALIMEAGNPIVERSASGAESVLSENNGLPNPPGESALLFYTTFSNPVEPVYSWNKSFKNSRDAFVGEELGTYFGFASELPGIRARNPNLNFDVTMLPQVRGGKNTLTYGRIYAFVVPRGGKNVGAAMVGARILGGNQFDAMLSGVADLPPARRDLLSVPQQNAYRSVFYNSAVMSRVWLDPSSEESRIIFRDMIDSVTSGKLRISNAVGQAAKELQNLIKKYGQ